MTRNTLAGGILAGLLLLLFGLSQGPWESEDSNGLVPSPRAVNAQGTPTDLNLPGTPVSARGSERAPVTSGPGKGSGQQAPNHLGLVTEASGAQLPSASGRVTLARYPAASVRVSAIFTAGRSVAVAFPGMKVEQGNQFVDPHLSPLGQLRAENRAAPPSVPREPALETRVQVTGADGRFEFKGLHPGRYEFTFEYPLKDDGDRRRAQGKHRVLRYVRLGPTAQYKFTDIVLPDEEEYLRIRDSSSIQAEVLVRCGRPGMIVEVEEHGTQKNTAVGLTNSSGELAFIWDESAPTRIGVYDSSKHLLGSTEGFVVLAPDSVNVFEIPATPGMLRVHLPPECEPQADEAVQYSVHRLPENQASHQVETVFAGAPARSTALLETTQRSLLLKSARSGEYRVIVRLLSEQADGRWLPVGVPLQAEAEVLPNKTTECHPR